MIKKELNDYIIKYVILSIDNSKIYNNNNNFIIYYIYNLVYDKIKKRFTRLND